MLEEYKIMTTLAVCYLNKSEMQDFKYYAPTEVVFGKDAEEHLVE